MIYNYDPKEYAKGTETEMVENTKNDTYKQNEFNRIIFHSVSHVFIFQIEYKRN